MGRNAEECLDCSTETEPMLGVLGCVDSVAEFRIHSQLQNLNRDLARMRYVSYHQAKLDCQRSAAIFINCFGGHQELKRFHFTAKFRMLNLFPHLLCC